MCLYMGIGDDMQFFSFFRRVTEDQGEGNAEASVLGDEGGIFLEGLSRIKDSTECRNAEVSVLGNVSIFLLSVYMECEIFQNAGMKEQILNRTSQNFGMNIYFNYKFYCWFWNLIEEQLKIRWKGMQTRVDLGRRGYFSWECISNQRLYRMQECRSQCTWG